jgi:hypothetical protein
VPRAHTLPSLRPGDPGGSWRESATLSSWLSIPWRRPSIPNARK